MSRRILALLLCVLMFVLLLPAAAIAEEDYDVVTIQKGDTVRKLLKANGREYDTDKYIVMVLNGMDRESQMEILTIGETIKIPKALSDIEGSAPHLISSRDKIEYYVIPYSIQKGDTLKYIYKLWGLHYDDYVDAIRALNPDKDLDMLYVGSLYLLPTSENNLRTKIYTTVMSHIMIQDETVADVYSRYGIDFENDREHLQTFNVIDFDKIKSGDKLLIPLE
jgi:LysM domain.